MVYNIAKYLAFSNCRIASHILKTYRVQNAPNGLHTSLLPEMIENFGRHKPICGVFTPSEFVFAHLGSQRNIGSLIDLRNKSTDDSPLFVAQFDRFAQFVELLLKLWVDHNSRHVCLVKSAGLCHNASRMLEGKVSEHSSTSLLYLTTAMVET
jgi:hypothetical protein